MELQYEFKNRIKLKFSHFCTLSNPLDVYLRFQHSETSRAAALRLFT